MDESITLVQRNANHIEVNIGDVQLVFSFGALVGLKTYAHPYTCAVFRPGSTTTSRHLTESGLGRKAGVDVECTDETELTALALKALGDSVKLEG